LHGLKKAGVNSVFLVSAIFRSHGEMRSPAACTKFLIAPFWSKIAKYWLPGIERENRWQTNGYMQIEVCLSGR